ncbi:FadR/GntR family transcriptional regulator [Tessaracoccus sp. MC1756]|uniref:FadR/GntR family transcriptional regulator n=1 Tax=Tessaracoccus sp. MC1756 TaxID=2760311 RepID=UPI0015FFF6BC|nr:FCD domain-containing protein [Tessaracoccus sp. MC1756]MBB1510374.1 FadR family transcriptional regulator [Tessaracoccus sp. MC1756]
MDVPAISVSARRRLAPPYRPEPGAVSNLRFSVVEDLGTQICAGELPAGTTLHMTELAVERGVSRSVMREAVGVLASLGLVASRRRVGTVVQPMTEWELVNGDVIRWRLMSPDRARQIIELSELRSAIEPAAASLAAQRVTDADRAELGECLKLLLTASRDNDIPEFHRQDKRFHTMVLEMGHNSMFGALHRLVEGMLEARYLQGLLPQRVDPQALEWHHRLGDAIIAGDEDAARESARLIVTLSAAEMLEMAQGSVTG